METLSIGDAAQRLALSAHTLRYYERAGLLDMVARNAAGRRVYTDADLHWISLLMCLRSSGMPIADMKKFSDLVRAGMSSVPGRIALLEQHRAKVVSDMAMMQSALAVIDAKLERYRGISNENQKAR
jgi:DNA-binding transcriptional MerR regulator